LEVSRFADFKVSNDLTMELFTTPSHHSPAVCSTKTLNQSVTRLAAVIVNQFNLTELTASNAVA
jgi:hypothetical protein